MKLTKDVERKKLKRDRYFQRKAAYKWFCRMRDKMRQPKPAKVYKVREIKKSLHIEKK